MHFDSPRTLRLRLIVAELIARPGAGPLAPIHFPRPGGLPRRPPPAPEPEQAVPATEREGP